MTDLLRRHRWLDKADLQLLDQLYPQGMITRLLADLGAAKGLLESALEIIEWDSNDDLPTEYVEDVCGRIRAIPNNRKEV